MSQLYFQTISTLNDSIRILYGISTRHDGDMRNEETLRQFCEKQHISLDSVILMNQIHGIRTACISTSFKEGSANLTFPHTVRSTDALVCTLTNCTLGILTADCLPVIAYDTRGHISAAIHAGREGIVSGIYDEVLRHFLSVGTSLKDIEILIGPSVGPCCYPMDLWSFSENFFHKKGITKVYNKHICTSCNNNLFFSYRKEKEKAGRMLTYIQIKTIKATAKDF